MPKSKIAGSTKNRTNRLPKSNASSKLSVGRPKQKDGPSSNRRTQETVQRLKMYTNGKPMRDKRGKIVAGTFMMKDRAGDRTIDASTGRIQPDRRWFGNTRVIASEQLDQFRQEMTQAVADPYSVVLKRKKIPMGLLKEAAEYSATNQAKEALLEQEPFEHAFGKQSRRKRVKIDQLMMERTIEDAEGRNKKSANKVTGEGKAHAIGNINRKSDDDDEDESASAYASLLKAAQKSQDTYQEINTRDGIVPWGRDQNLERKEGEGIDWRVAKKDDLFLKGQSKRIWGEFFKVIDCSDIILHVIDARNVPGTRCSMIESHIKNNAKHKHLVFVLNKIDLVPNWVAKRWMGELAKDRPTIAFHASLNHAFGKGALISLLRQFGTLHEDKKQISVGIVGYPNTGKSSVINTLISKKSCKVAPIPGETKIWQYITLFKRISLIDCPGVVVNTAEDTEEDSVLKGVIRAERLENPEDFVDAIVARVKREHINAQYKLTKDHERGWTTSIELMETISKRSGRLLKGGDPCIRSAAINIINDYQRGRLPHYVPPPELKEDDEGTAPEVTDGAAAGTDTESTGQKDIMEKIAKSLKQDLDKIGEEYMNPEKATGRKGDGSDSGARRGQNAADGEDECQASDAEESHSSSSTSGENEEDEEDDKSVDGDGDDEDKNCNPENLIAAGEWDD